MTLKLPPEAVMNIEVIGDGVPPQDAQKGCQQGHSERGGESYSVPYDGPLSDARTPLAVFLRILLSLLIDRIGLNQ